MDFTETENSSNGEFRVCPSITRVDKILNPNRDAVIGVLPLINQHNAIYSVLLLSFGSGYGYMATVSLAF